MQCREFSIMADLSDKYYTVKSFTNTLSYLVCPVNRKKMFQRIQNAIIVKNR